MAFHDQDMDIETLAKTLPEPQGYSANKRTDIGKALITRESVNNVDKDHSIYDNYKD